MFLIALFTACNILINGINGLQICLKTLCVKNKVLSCSTFLYATINETTIDLACLVCTVKYRTSVFLVLKNLSPIFHGTDLTLGQ